MSSYITVSEYAKLFGKDPGNIRRFLKSGRMEGEKIGNQWVLSKDAEYPADQRETSGLYHNWRKRATFNKNRDLKKSVADMVVNLQSIYGDNLLEVILYGSYARGTQEEESDIDIALILNDIPTGKATDQMIQCVSSYELETDKVLSVIDIQLDTYDRWKDVMPFYRNIKKEGIVLWKRVV